MLDSLPNVKLEGLNNRFSRASLTEVFGGLGLAEVHGPKLPKPDLGKLGDQIHCLQAQFTSLKPGHMKQSEAGVRQLPAKMRRRRGWCGCLTRSDDPPEITYCVADNGGGGLTLQALTPTTPMPDEQELNEKFAELVVSYDIFFCIISTLTLCNLNNIRAASFECIDCIQIFIVNSSIILIILSIVERIIPKLQVCIPSQLFFTTLRL